MPEIPRYAVMGNPVSHSLGTVNNEHVSITDGNRIVPDGVSGPVRPE